MAKKKSSGFKLTINWSKWLIASIAVFVVMFGLDYLIHQNLLKDLYQANYRLFTSEAVMKARMSSMFLVQAGLAAVFVFIYTQGFSGKQTVAEGLRYGLYIGALFAVTHLGMYAWSLYPLNLIQAWAATCLAEFIILGGVVGALYSHK